MLKFILIGLAFLPFVELLLFILLGPLLGLGLTLLEILVSALLGVYLLKVHSRLNLAQAEALARAGQFPALEALQNLGFAISGVLLIIPGFFSDLLGLGVFLICFNQGVLERLIKSWLRSSVAPVQSGPRIIEGEYRRED